MKRVDKTQWKESIKQLFIMLNNFSLQNNQSSLSRVRHSLQLGQATQKTANHFLHWVLINQKRPLVIPLFCIFVWAWFYIKNISVVVPLVRAHIYIRKLCARRSIRNHHQRIVHESSENRAESYVHDKSNQCTYINGVYAINWVSFRNILNEGSVNCSILFRIDH